MLNHEIDSLSQDEISPRWPSGDKEELIAFQSHFDELMGLLPRVIAAINEVAKKHPSYATFLWRICEDVTNEFIIDIESREGDLSIAESQTEAGNPLDEQLGIILLKLAGTLQEINSGVIINVLENLATLRELVEKTNAEYAGE